MPSNRKYSGASLAKGIGESIKFAGLYTIYGMGYRWSYPADSGEPDNFFGKVSWNAMKTIDKAGPSPGREAGYYMSLCGIPGVLAGEFIYFLSSNGGGNSAPK